MSSKVQLYLACVIALIIMLLVSRPVRHVHPTAKGPQKAGIATIQLNRQGAEMQLMLTFTDPQGGSAAPAMSTEPTFAIVDSTGNTVYGGKFEFG